jgi:hypothetical protein
MLGPETAAAAAPVAAVRPEKRSIHEAKLVVLQVRIVEVFAEVQHIQ